MNETIKIGMLGIVSVLIALQFKGYKPEYTGYIGIGAAILVFCYVIKNLYVLSGQLGSLQQYLNGKEAYLGTLFKIVGITYICEFSAGICKDAGFLSIAGQIEIFGKLVILFSGLPILLAVLDMIQGLI